MDKDDRIRTEFDDIIANLKSAGGKPVSVWQLSSKSGMTQKNVMEWLLVLEKSGQVQIQNRLGGEYAVWVGQQGAAKIAEQTSRDSENIRASYESQVTSARQQESDSQAETPDETRARHQQELLQMNQDLLSMSEQLGRVDDILVKLKEKKKEARQAELARERLKESAQAAAAQESPEDKRVADWISEQEKIEAEKMRQAEFDNLADEAAPDDLADRQAALKRRAEEQKLEEAAELQLLQNEKRALEEKVQQERLAEEKRKRLELDRKAAQEKREAELRTRRKLEEERSKAAKAHDEESKALALLEQVEKEVSSIRIGEPEERTEHTVDFTSDEKSEKGEDFISTEPERMPIGELEPQTGSQKIEQLFSGEKQRAKSQKIKKPQQVQVTGASLQFSEKLARQVKKIIGQAQELEKLRMEKEKLLGEHYMPMQRRLESEIETISDRIIRMEKNIFALHQRASDLPGKVSGVEKLQHTSIKAHNQMQRAFDESSALIEESARQLSDEREKMEMMIEESRHEISTHRAKSEELEKTLKHISQLEEESTSLVVSARAALAEQAERLATAEMHSQELVELKGEIRGSIDSIKREIASTKGILSGMEKQMGQMRQIEIWAESIKQDYTTKMSEVGNYIKDGNEEFETLRESVEANFVRRYLRELRALTDSYSFEFGQAKNLEANLDQRISEEKKQLEQLLDEGRKISYLYETQSREVAGESKFEKRAEAFKSLSELSGQRQMLQQMISQVTGGKSEIVEKIAPTKPNVRIFGAAPKIRISKARKQAKKTANRAKAKARKGKKR